MEEKAAVSKAKNRFLKLLTKAPAVAVIFHNLPFSPNKEKRSSDKSKSKGFSGASDGDTMISIVPVDVLYSKSRNSSLREPTSPKVSCMGQIKHKKKLYSLINTNYTYQDSVLPRMDHLNQIVQNQNNSKQVKKKKKPLAIKNMFSSVPTERRKSDATIHPPDDHRESSCSLSQTKVAQEVDNSEKGSTGCKEAGKVSIGAAAPSILQECKAVRLGPKKEVNLWKRRTMAQPSPLQLQT